MIIFSWYPKTTNKNKLFSPLLMNNGNLLRFDILFHPGFVNFVVHEKTEDIPETANSEIQAYRSEAVHPDPECSNWSSRGTGCRGHQEPGPPDPAISNSWVGPGIPSCPVFYLPHDRDLAGCCVHKIH